MTIKSSGILTMADIVAEFGSSGNPVRLSDYYRGGPRVPNIAANNAISTSGRISIGMFYGAVNWVYVPGSQTYSVAGTYQFTVPDHITTVTITLQGPGGGGGCGRDSGANYYSAAGGGGGGKSVIVLSVNPGDIITIEVGVGGVGGSTYSPFGANGGITSATHNGITYYAYGGGGASPAQSEGVGAGGIGTTQNGNPGAIGYNGGGGQAGHGGDSPYGNNTGGIGGVYGSEGGHVGTHGGGGGGGFGDNGLGHYGFGGKGSDGEAEIAW
jgi:hypothetical protein